MRRNTRTLPGFGLSLGITMSWLGLIALVPLMALCIRSSSLGWTAWRAVLTDARVLAALRLSFGAALIAAFLNTIFGLCVAWALCRCRLPLAALWDAIVDLPFALPTAVAGIALTAVYAQDGWLGRILEGRLGWKIAFAPAGIVVALTFIGLPFVVRTVEPVLEALDRELEEAAECLGATPLQVFWRVVLPALRPALLTGFAMAFARAVGEYGSVVFISGNLPGKTEIAPLLIVGKLEQYDYAGATAIASIMLAVSALVLAAITWLQLPRRKAQA